MLQPQEAKLSAGPPAGSVPSQTPGTVTPPSFREFIAVAWGPMAIVGATLFMAGWTWGRWPDVLIGFGRELYVPWRLSEGDVLYRDIMCLTGPFSQYFNALCFHLFGTSLRTLVYCNLAILIGLMGLLYYALRQVARQWAATIAILAFVLLFAFAQFVEIGSYNYVCPCSHEMTHGLVLSLAALVAAWQIGRRGYGAAAVSGLCLGIVLLTRVEAFLPAAAATATAVVGWLWLERPGRVRGAAILGVGTAAMLIPPAIALVGLASAMPLREAWLGMAGFWTEAFDRRVLALPIFQQGMGIDRPGENLIALAKCLGEYLAVLGPAAGLALLVRRRRTAAAVAAILFATIAVLAWWLMARIDWYGLGRPLSVLVLAAGIVAVWRVRGCRGEELLRRELLRRISLLVLALSLLGTMLLNCRIEQEGYVLAMPAALLMIVAALDWVPRFIDRRGGSGRVFATASIAVLLAITTVHLGAQAEFERTKRVLVGAGADAFVADMRRGPIVNQAVLEIVNSSDPSATLAAMPEGAMINWLTRRRNPTPYFSLLPTEVGRYGEDRILEALRKDRPDLIAVVHRDTREYGVRYFGENYGVEIGRWIPLTYRYLHNSGATPLHDEHFGIQLLIRADRAR